MRGQHSLWVESTQKSFLECLTFNDGGPLSYENHSINLESKSIDWLLYDIDLHHERVKFGHHGSSWVEESNTTFIISFSPSRSHTFKLGPTIVEDRLLNSFLRLNEFE